MADSQNDDWIKSVVGIPFLILVNTRGFLKTLLITGAAVAVLCCFLHFIKSRNMKNNIIIASVFSLVTLYVSWVIAFYLYSDVFTMDPFVIIYGINYIVHLPEITITIFWHQDFHFNISGTMLGISYILEVLLTFAACVGSAIIYSLAVADTTAKESPSDDKVASNETTSSEDQ